MPLMDGEPAARIRAPCKHRLYSRRISKSHCISDGCLEFKKRQHYEKPSVRRKRKALAARKKAKRRERVSD